MKKKTKKKKTHTQKKPTHTKFQPQAKDTVDEIWA